MLTCLPQSICSWDYRVPDAPGGGAEIYIDLNLFSDKGRIIVGPEEFQIRRSGFFTGKWTLTHHGAVVVEAARGKISVNDRLFILKRAFPPASPFNILEGERRVGRIHRVHAFTRRAIIDCDPAVPELVQLFAFWLVVRTSWRNRRSHSVIWETIGGF